MSASSNRVYGLRPVTALLERGGGRPVRQIFVAEGERAAAVAEVARRADVPVVVVATEALDTLAEGAVHQGVVAVVGEFAYVDLEALFIAPSGAPLLLLVDGVTDPQNLGAMIRSALVLGATGVVLTKDRCAAINAVVTRVSCGATEYLPCAQVTNLVRAMGELKQAAIWVAGTVEQGGVAPADQDLTVPLALVLGSEGKGMRPLVQRHCDFLLTIPTQGPIAALNVGTATGVLFYEVARQRRRALASKPS